MTAVEAWVIACLTFVFLALIEYGIVSRFENSSKEKVEKLENILNEVTLPPLDEIDSENILQVQSLQETFSSKYGVTQEQIQTQIGAAKRLPYKIDKIAFWLLPFLFLIFNVAYWTYYLYQYYTS